MPSAGSTQMLQFLATYMTPSLHQMQRNQFNMPKLEKMQSVKSERATPENERKQNSPSTGSQSSSHPPSTSSSKPQLHNIF